jgi:hypothetical protein
MANSIHLVNVNADECKGKEIEMMVSFFFLSLTRIINEDVMDGRTEERTLTCCDRVVLMSLRYHGKETRQIKIDCKKAWQ